MDFQKLERVRIAAALLAAVLTGGAALYGVYVRARAEARKETAASYETLAPAVNDLKEAVRQLQARAETDGPEPPAAAKEAPAPSRAEAPRTTSGRRRAPAARPTAAPPPEPAPAAEPSPAEPTPPPAAGEPERRRPEILEDVEKRVPIDFEKAWEVWKDIRKDRDAR